MPVSPPPSGKKSPRIGGAFALRFVPASTALVTDFLASAWANWIQTGPTPHTHHTVRVPLPYALPAWVIFDSIRTAETGFANAGTVTSWMPTTLLVLRMSLREPPWLDQVRSKLSGSCSIGTLLPQIRL